MTGPSEIMAIFLFVALGYFLSLMLADIWAKLTDFESFVEDLAAYEIVPDRLSRTGAMIIVTVEMITFASLCFQATRLAGFAGSATLFSAYALFMAINLLRGRTDIACGCGGSKSPISWAMVGRNVTYAVFLLGLAGVAMPPGVPPIASVTAISLGIGLHFLLSAWTRLAVISSQVEAGNTKRGANS